MRCLPAGQGRKRGNHKPASVFFISILHILPNFLKCAVGSLQDGSLLISTCVAVSEQFRSETSQLWPGLHHLLNRLPLKWALLTVNIGWSHPGVLSVLGVSWLKMCQLTIHEKHCSQLCYIRNYHSDIHTDTPSFCLPGFTYCIKAPLFLLTVSTSEPVIYQVS